MHCLTTSQFKNYFLSTYYVLGGFSFFSVSIPHAFGTTHPSLMVPPSLAQNRTASGIHSGSGTWHLAKLCLYVVPFNVQPYEVGADLFGQ